MNLVSRFLYVACLSIWFGVPFFAPSTAGAWNKAGHMTSAAIAYHELRASSPQALNQVLALLRQHPQFEDRWSALLERVPQQDRDLYLFMLAARWPDDIRGDPDFHHEKWHYINFPYRPPSPSTMKPNEENILDTFRQNAEELRNVSADVEDRAIALCWVMHQLGDVHQPLHSTKLINQQFPEGDRGGTRFYVRVTDTGSTLSLHKVWDDLVIRSERFQAVRNKSIELANRPELQRNNLPEISETQFENWARLESFKLAREIAYQGGQLESGADEDHGTLLPDGYINQAKPLCERRMVLSGYRLADLLKGIFGN